ncbi:MAG: hypothetical protein KC590_07510 [Nitrospira sp.]|nr:hypothetical protein [Nitrospira sp.]
MVLLIAHSTDLFATRVAHRLQSQGQQVKIVSWPMLLFGEGFSWIGGCRPGLGDGEFRIQGARIPISDLTGILCFSSGRLEHLASNDWEADEKAYMFQEGAAAHLAILHGCPCPVFNLPVPGEKVRLFFASRTGQDSLRAFSLRVAPMAVATSRQAALEWVDGYTGPLRLGSLFDPDCNRMGYFPNGLDEWDDTVISYPVFLQRFPQGQLYHIIIVGNSVIGGKVHHSDFDGSFVTGVIPEPIPQELTQALVHGAKSVGLGFCECLVLEREHGEWMCADWNEFPRLGHWSEAVGEMVIEQLCSVLRAGRVGS